MNKAFFTRLIDIAVNHLNIYLNSIQHNTFSGNLLLFPSLCQLIRKGLIIRKPKYFKGNLLILNLRVLGVMFLLKIGILTQTMLMKVR